GWGATTCGTSFSSSGSSRSSAGWRAAATTTDRRSATMPDLGTKQAQLLVIGAGPGGYPAAFAAADHGLKVTMVDSDPQPGGVCLNRGCIPSKALLHVAKLTHEVKEAAQYGVTFGEPKFDLDKLRTFVQKSVIGKLNSGVAALAKGRGVEYIKAKATFEDSRTV